MDINHAVHAFLGRNNFPAGGPDIHAAIQTLLYDIEEGLVTDPSNPPGNGPSLDMIPTWAVPPDRSPQNNSVIVIDAGGTNFRSCLVTFDIEGKAEISHLEKSAMPATEREYSREEFFDAMASRLDHLKNRATRIGFCFSYAMTITKEGDGRVIQFSKEIRAPEVIGTLVGKGLSDALVARGWVRPEKITLLNDTTAALLAGASTASGGKRYDSYVGFILGTGMNAAYIEYDTIAKIGSDCPEKQIVVCESGKSNKLPRSRFDEILDAATNSPGLYGYEKMCSGAYLGPLFRIALSRAAADGLFSADCVTGFKSLENDTGFSLKEADQFLCEPWSTNSKIGAILARGTERDTETAWRILDAFVERSARLAAANIAAVVMKSGKGKNPARPVCIVCEGTTFLRTRNLRERVTGYLETVLTLQRDIHFEIVTMDNAVTFGSAVAGLI